MTPARPVWLLGRLKAAPACERGMSLVEATVILMVLATLTAVIAPVATGYMEDARQAAAKEETEAIGSAVLRVLSDTGSRCLRLLGTTDCTVTNRVDLLVSSGSNPRAIDLASSPDITLTDPESATDATVNWLPDGSAPTQQDLLEDQLIENDNATPYSAVSFTGGGGPRMKVGWRGPYLNGPFTADPWGGRYQVNTMFLAVATNAIDTSLGANQFQEGIYQAGWNRDVLVLSAGQNGMVQTSFGGASATAGVSAGGDDVVYVLRGSSR
jgi:type II secretory pathway pseudopilin PulG